ncbi:Protein CBG26015 [Caenorhabditis briggsae]|uniref:Protein CBG26015 n=1 Tax=Caenorhabditis briggsae TaxID=6238 RepID=B6IGI8_CAEBR|nr:Protein CBG26015 [Caenorhabditis briggsae]CAR99018.1 Protein CBG26015 [Caenorhabditis briggsae]
MNFQAPRRHQYSKDNSEIDEERSDNSKMFIANNCMPQFRWEDENFVKWMFLFTNTSEFKENEKFLNFRFLQNWNLGSFSFQKLYYQNYKNNEQRKMSKI